MKICLGSLLHSYTGGKSEVEAKGETVGAVLDDLDRQYPGLRFRIVDEQDRIRPHMHVHCGEEMVRDLGRRVVDGEVLYVLGALSGG